MRSFGRSPRRAGRWPCCTIHTPQRSAARGKENGDASAMSCRSFETTLARVLIASGIPDGISAMDWLAFWKLMGAARFSTSWYGYAVPRDPGREDFLGPGAEGPGDSRFLSSRAPTLRGTEGRGTTPDSHLPLITHRRDPARSSTRGRGQRDRAGASEAGVRSGQL